MKYELTPELRKKLKQPMGEKTSHFEKPFIAVGDICLSNALEHNEPMLGIYDNIVQRKPSTDQIKQKINTWKAKKQTVENPPGTISTQAINAIKQALSNKEKTKIEINGEEDLLVLPCMIYAQEGVNIYYGQPNESMVVVKTNQKNKEKAKKILEEMKQ